MSILARQYLAISATFASSKRIFSQALNIITKKQNKLSKDTFKMIMYLKNWNIMKDSEKELIDEKNQISEYDRLIYLLMFFNLFEYLIYFYF
jgi:hypothetical protein